MSTTFEEAKLCPRCDLPGEHMSTTAGKDRRSKPVKICLIYCRNRECVWFDTSWVVQVNEDGSIPEPYSALGAKQFPQHSAETVSRIEDNIRRQLEAETRPGGGEIRG